MTHPRDKALSDAENAAMESGQLGQNMNVMIRPVAIDALASRIRDVLAD